MNMIRKNILLFILICSSFLTISIIAGSSYTKDCPVRPRNKVGLLIPYYITPPSSYTQLIVSARAQYPNVPMLIIINPDSGVGPSLDPAFVTLIQTLHAAGAKVLGYVATNYALRPLSDVENEINTWMQWYDIDGFFLDEMAEDHLYYSTLTAYIKSLGFKIVAANPGMFIDPSFSNDADIIVLYEDAGVPTLNQFVPWAGLNAKMSLLAFAVDTLPINFIRKAATQFGWMYITNDTLPNPWDTLPPYFNALVATLSKINRGC